MKITQIELNTYSFYRHIARFLQDCHKSKNKFSIKSHIKFSMNYHILFSFIKYTR